MAEYEVRDVVCDYGVYEDGELKLILNSRKFALQIVELLKEDERKHMELNNIKDYPPYLDRPKKGSERMAEWILYKPRRTNRNATYKCSVCGKMCSSYYNDVGEWKYCPHCGKRMKGGEE